MTPAEKDELIAELAEAFLERVRGGEILSVAEYAAQHPACEDDLLDILPMMLEVEGVGRTCSPPAPMLAHYPERLGDYHLLERIGSGGMGTVFRARQESLHREVAVKILAPSWSTDARVSVAFENESRVLAGLRHTNIVDVYGAGQEGRYRYYVMGLVQGQGLSAGRLGAAFPGMPYELAVTRVGIQAANALAFAHAHGVIHRDIKPGNLLMGNDGILLVSDFGLATILNAGEQAPLVAQSHDGTVRYMAPERLRGERDTFAGDQYSLGLTLYELLSRRQAFKDVEGGKLVKTISEEPLPPLKGFGELGAVINKAIAFNPEMRYDSMQELADDLQRVLEREPVKALPNSMWRSYRLWMRRRPAAALWSHVAAGLMLLLYATITFAYTSVKHSLRNENEQRERAELNEQIADASLQRVFASMVAPASAEDDALPPSRADARLLQDLMPYYEQLAEREDMKSDKVREATSTLAAIAQQTGEYSMAEKYYRQLAEQAAVGSRAHIAATIGVATAVFSQEDVKRYRDGVRMLLALVKQVPEQADFETRLELVRALQLAARYEWRAALPGPGRKSNGADAQSRRKNLASAVLGTEGSLSEQAADRLAQLLAEQPNHAAARLLQAELLSARRDDNVRAVLAPHGEQPVNLLTQLLAEEPQNHEYKRAYVRLAAARTNPNDGKADLARAAAYAQELLATSAADSELMMLYLSVRAQYVRDLEQQGKTAQAAGERERTLGVLSFVTSRNDFTPTMRERLVKWVSRRYHSNTTDLNLMEEELRTLLQDFDAERIRSLRSRFLRLQRNTPARGRHSGKRSPKFGVENKP